MRRMYVMGATVEEMEENAKMWVDELENVMLAPHFNCLVIPPEIESEYNNILAQIISEIDYCMGARERNEQILRKYSSYRK